MRIALLGDVHLFAMAVPPWRLASKRLLGQANLWLNRARRFNTGALPGLIRAIEAQRPDALLGTGDLTTTSLDAEFRDAATRLGPLFDRQPTFLIPGNHDRYTRAAARGRVMERYLGRWMGDGDQPHLDLGPNLALVTLDIAKPTGLHAGTSASERQLGRLRETLATVDADRRIVLMCHYPLGTPPNYPPEPRSHGLHNAADMRGVLAASGRPILYLHGHVHTPWCWRPGDAPNVLAINAGSPLYRGHGYPSGQGFWTIGFGDRGEVEALTHTRPDESGDWPGVEIEPPGGAGEVAADPKNAGAALT